MPSFLENDERTELNGVPDNYIGTTGTEVSITKAIKANKDADNGGQNVKVNFSVNNATETDNVATTGAELLAMLVSAKTEEQNGKPNHITRTGRNRGKLSIKPSVSILFVALLHILIAHKTIHIHAKSKSYTQDKNKSVYEVKKRDFSFWVCKFALHKKCSCDYAVCPPCYNDALKKLSKNDVVHIELKKGLWVDGDEKDDKNLCTPWCSVDLNYHHPTQLEVSTEHYHFDTSYRSKLRGINCLPIGCSKCGRAVQLIR